MGFEEKKKKSLELPVYAPEFHSVPWEEGLSAGYTERWIEQRNSTGTRGT